MTDISAIAAPLAAALQKRGYETLTPVQLSVLEDGLAGKDLLVSAQTGSGKTVAFGLAIAPDVLGDALLLPPAEAPLALIIAPTRELALQVKREIDWLYAEAGVLTASCVGGMDFRNERRALERGAHIVVGTPGRLKDHIERGTLDLSAIRAVVLDEADEMLDLGFAEDLEFILGAAPEGRRTLMFSATVPPEIAKLAESYQRDAVRLKTAAEQKQHVDIEYRAMSVANEDREHAIINVLRYFEARTAIVFCKTRAEVTHLMGRFHNRGFQVVALSGELSQQERTHALQAMRDGRARVCIATDVAARGIDLPGLELVVHADLPTNPETLLHRSGRTGRAGNKGTSVLIVTPRDYRKAQRILQGARVTATWGPAPSADEVQERDDARLMTAPELGAPVAEDEAAAVAALSVAYGQEALAAAFLRLWRAGRSAPEELRVTATPAAAQAVEAKRPREAFGDSVWYRLTVGHTGRAEARWILPKLCDQGRITKAEIGAIRVQQDETFVQIAEAAVKGFEAALGSAMELEPGLVLSRMAGEPSMERPAARAPRREPARFDAPEGPVQGKKSFRAAKYETRDEVKPARRFGVKARDEARDVSRGDEGDGAQIHAAPRKPYAKPAEDAPRKPYARTSEDAPRKPYGKPTEDAPRKPYTKPAADGPRKPYAKSTGDAPRKPYAKAEGAPRKPYAKTEDGPRKPYVKSAGGKSYEGKSSEARSSEDRPARPRAAGEDGPAKKPRWTGADKAGRPAKPGAPRRPPVNPADTSQRLKPRSGPRSRG